MKDIDIYSYIIQENLKLADPNILDPVVNGMNLTANNNLSTFIKHLRQKCGIYAKALKFVSKRITDNRYKMN